ncbi:hypothetical protein [Pseudomonas aeruginosa]|uniref:hypothetical protein n=1 Tax=Pseudomonas aeruginosa TaxID=287 RepID=UPI000FC425A1|nr:hypothetical protein [Pseudomonas aeruginosa]RUB40148.1 hypothetical protein IPC1432_04715 [Pseudomonas aeruginosa]HCD6630742.1 hypothetical protein [Pseudomonas aeruginosa]HDQ4735003.1 hypothetical protein [Pseudomonas aeruginosa]
MTVNFDVVIESPDYAVDMKSGLETLQGISDASRTITEALVTKVVPHRQTKGSPVRTTLKKTFQGSYGQNFSIDILDADAQRELRRLGHEVFIELLTYFMHEAVYVESPELSDRAQTALEELGDASEELMLQLRQSPMTNIHKVVDRYDYSVKIRYKKRALEPRVVADFNERTSAALSPMQDPNIVELTASITRLNINTGNGRLLLLGEDETVAFGFASGYQFVGYDAKKRFSENLNYNNGRERENWRHFRIDARPLRLPDGRVIKYFITGFSASE